MAENHILGTQKTGKMKRYIILLILAIATVSVIFVQSERIKRLKEERNQHRNNAAILMQDINIYRTKDSLNAAKVGALELSIKQFERYRAEDAAIIKDLKTKNRDLNALTKTQSQTIIDLRAEPKDTVIIRDSVKIPAISLSTGDKWYDFKGLLYNDKFTGQLSVRDSLLVVETVKYRRFLGFLWKTKRIENFEVDVTSKNPYTKIIGVESIRIKK